MFRVANIVLYPSIPLIQTMPSITNVSVNFTTGNQTVALIEQLGLNSYSLSIPFGFIAYDGTGYLLGSRMRQLRVVQTQCSVPQYLLQYFPACTPAYSESAKDTSSWTNNTLPAFKFNDLYSTYIYLYRFLLIKICD